MDQRNTGEAEGAGKESEIEVGEDAGKDGRSVTTDNGGQASQSDRMGIPQDKVAIPEAMEDTEVANTNTDVRMVVYSTEENTTWKGETSNHQGRKKDGTTKYRVEAMVRSKWAQTRCIRDGI